MIQHVQLSRPYFVWSKSADSICMLIVQSKSFDFLRLLVSLDTKLRLVFTFHPEGLLTPEPDSWHGKTLDSNEFELNNVCICKRT